MNTGHFNFSTTFYRIATAPAFLISAMLTYLLVEYSIHGAQALEADTKMKALAALVAVVLAVSQLAGSAYASLLAGQSLTLRCFGLRTLAYFICAVEFFTSVGMQLSTALGADMVQAQVSSREESLQARIKKFEDSAREKREGAQRQESAACGHTKNGRATCDPYELSLAAKQRQKATDDMNKAEALQAELTSVQVKKAPTFVGSLGQAGGILGVAFDAGKAFAIMLIVSRVFGLCAGALLFSELAGALLRRGWPGVKESASPAPQVATGHAKPTAPGIPVVPKVSFSVRLLRAMGVLTSGAAAATAPAVRAEPVTTPPAVTAPAAPKSIPAAIPEKSTGIPEEVCTPLPVEVCQPKKSEPGEVWDGTPAHTRKKQVPAKQVVLTLPEIEKLKTDPKFQELRVQVAANKVRVSIQGIRQFSKVGQDKAVVYREALFAEFPQLRAFA